MANGIREAEKLGLDCFVLAYEAGRGVYARNGFRVLDEIVQDNSKYGGPGRYACYLMEYKVGKK